MAKFFAYFGKNSNGPEKQIEDTWLTGLSTQPFGKKATKTSYSGIGEFKNKTYVVSYKGKKFTYTNYGLLDEGHVNSLKLFENNKLKQNWEISYEISYWLTYAKDGLKGLNLFLAYLYSSSDEISGGKGKDKLWGYLGNDKISGGYGNDILCGGLGNDKLIGGKGKDIFKLSKGEGYDLIQDFKDNQDKIYIGSMKKLKLKNKGNDVYIYKGKDLLAKVKGAKGVISKKGKYLV